jgi:protein ImuB
MYAVIFIPDFSLQAALRSEPGLSSQPVALVDSGAPRLGVLQLTSAARSGGVREGQTPSQATARCKTLKIKTRSFPQEEVTSQLLLQVAFSFSPRVEATTSGVCTLDLQGLPLGLLSEKWCSNIFHQLAQFHVSSRIGIASTPSLALLAARHAQSALILNNPASFVAALPISALEPEVEIAEILNLWGIRTAGQFLALGKEQVVERLGPAALNLFNRAALDFVRPLKLALQPDEFVEQIEFENEIETLEPLLATLRQFIEQLAARLGCLHLVIGELDLRLGLSSGVEHRERFKIPVPTGDVKVLCRLLHTRLENVRTDAAISSIRLEARPAPPDANQLGLFVTTLVNPFQFAETLGRLSTLCGNERVGIPAAEATLRPDAFRMKSPQLTEESEFGSVENSQFCFSPMATHGDTAGVRPSPGAATPGFIRASEYFKSHLLADIAAPGDGRAPVKSKRKAEPAPILRPLGLQLRRFRPPLAAKIDFRDERPADFRSASFGGTITDMRGPFVTSGEWWDKSAWSRKEWDVQTSDGSMYRLVRTPEGDFLEGVYD